VCLEETPSLLHHHYWKAGVAALPSIAAQCVRRAISDQDCRVLIISLVHSAGRGQRDSIRGRHVNFSTPVQHCFAAGHEHSWCAFLLGGQAGKQSAVSTKPFNSNRRLGMVFTSSTAIPRC
jgi:hypothetical protein